MKKILLICITLTAVLLLSGIALAASGLLRTVALEPGRVVDLVPLENGDAAIIQSRSIQRDFLLTFVSADNIRQSYTIPWNSTAEPTATVRACETTVHIVLTTDSGVAQYIEWQLPVEVQRVYLPIVCTAR